MAHHRRSLPAALLALASLTALLAACDRGGSNPTPTSTIDDTFVIVTATSGSTAKKSPTVERARIYVVEEGDSLSSIADRFGVTEETLVEFNNLAGPDDIEVGQVLLIPLAGDATE